MVLSLGVPSIFSWNASTAISFGQDWENEDGVRNSIYGSVNSFSTEISAVPVPAAAWLFGSSIGKIKGLLVANLLMNRSYQA
jgi:hypothetical protein